MTRFLSLLTTTFSVLAATLLSVFIYAHIVATLGMIEIPLVHAVTSTQLPYSIFPISENNFPRTDADKYGFFGHPVTLRIPRMNTTINLEPSIKSKTGFLTTLQSGYVIPFATSKAGKLGDILVYTADKSPVLDVVGILVENDRLVIDTNTNWRYHFKVKSIAHATREQPYLPSHSTQSRLYLIRPSTDQSAYILEASLANLEEINL